MAYTLTSDISRMLATDLTDVFTENFENYPLEWPSFCTEKKGTKQTEKYDSMGNIAGAQLKAEGDKITYRKLTQAYQTTLTHKTVTNGIEFTIEAKKYDQYKTLTESQGKELARTMREFEEQRAIRWFDNYDQAAYALADGQPWGTNSRVCYNAPGTFNDTLATAGTLKNPENHKTMMKMFADFKNHAGGKMKAYPTNGLTHRYNMADIEEIYQSDKKANEMSNTKNVLPSIKFNYSTYLASTTYWCMYDNRYEHLLFSWFQKTYNNAGEDDRDTLNFWYNAVAMYETAVLPSIGIVHNAGA